MIIIKLWIDDVRTPDWVHAMDSNGIVATSFFKPIEEPDVVAAIDGIFTSIMVDINKFNGRTKYLKHLFLLGRITTNLSLFPDYNNFLGKIHSFASNITLAHGGRANMRRIIERNGWKEIR